MKESYFLHVELSTFAENHPYSIILIIYMILLFPNLPKPSSSFHPPTSPHHKTILTIISTHLCNQLTPITQLSLILEKKTPQPQTKQITIAEVDHLPTFSNQPQPPSIFQTRVKPTVAHRRPRVLLQL